MRDGGRRVSPNTVRRILKEADSQVRTKKKKPALKQTHGQARLAWARRHRDWTKAQWHNVRWSDGSKINKHGSDGRSSVWVPTGSPLTSKEVIPTHKFGGGGRMVTENITAAGVGPLTIIDGISTADRNIEILNDHLLPFSDAFRLIPGLPGSDTLTFQQENDPKHTAKKTKPWLQAHNVDLMDWPAQSPDLNPIKNVWHKLKVQLKSHPQSAKDLDSIKKQ